jgi:hypothetical protein
MPACRRQGMATQRSFAFDPNQQHRKAYAGLAGLLPATPADSSQSSGKVEPFEIVTKAHPTPVSVTQIVQDW